MKDFTTMLQQPQLAVKALSPRVHDSQMYYHMDIVSALVTPSCTNLQTLVYLIALGDQATVYSYFHSELTCIFSAIRCEKCQSEVFKYMNLFTQ